MNSKHVCVVGAGIVGLFTAWRLIREGHQVTLLEQREGPGLSTSFANGAQLSYSYVAPLAEPAALIKFPKWLLDADGPLRFTPALSPAYWLWCLKFAACCNSPQARRTTRDMLSLSLLSRDLLRALVLEEHPAPALHYRQNGKLVVYRDSEAFHDARAQMAYQATLGCEQFAMSARDCAETEVALGGLADKLAGGIYTPSEDVIDSHALCGHLARLITEQGGEIRYYATVTGQRAGSGRLLALETPIGDFAAEAFVVAGGLESRALLRRLGVRVPLLGLKGYSITINCAGGVAPSISITDSHHKLVFARLGDRLRVAGMVDMGTENLDIPRRRIAALSRQARDNFPLAGDYDHAEAWAGLRSATPSGRPVIDRLGYANLYVNIGHGTLGMTLAAGSAELVADRLAGRRSRIDVSPFRLANA